MTLSEYKEELVNLVDECFLHLEQIVWMVELLQKIEILHMKDGNTFNNDLNQLRIRLSKMAEDMKSEKYAHQLSILCYRASNLFLDVKDRLEELLDILENKVSFPQDFIDKELIVYCICEVGVKLLLIVKYTYRVNSIGFELHERSLELYA